MDITRLTLRSLLWRTFALVQGLTATMIKQGSNQALRFTTFYQLKTWMLGDPALDFDRSTIKAVFQTIFAGASSPG
jgi:hypothetical protein